MRNTREIPENSKLYDRDYVKKKALEFGTLGYRFAQHSSIINPAGYLLRSFNLLARYYEDITGQKWQGEPKTELEQRDEEVLFTSMTGLGKAFISLSHITRLTSYKAKETQATVVTFMDGVLSSLTKEEEAQS